ncbi:hypothetical protein TIFTF001_043276 [Ficus carica]|uniref:Uncharacterized protein n=1 Tax=Ficus carica TaxID=3494 RepID=A0AA87ZAY3_FICCA|nr:hypothetical protein TIFTF001_043276 [Ficus carica]
MGTGLHTLPLLRRREKPSISSKLRRKPCSHAEEPELRRTELRDLVELAGGERNLVGRSELVVEDRALLSEQERNGQRDERER